VIAVDTSVVVAIVREESDARAFSDAMAGGRILIGTPTLLEASMVLPTVVGKSAADSFLRDFLDDSAVEPVPFSLKMFEAAKAAFERYGRGRHPAKLNFGDCMSYAVAKVLDAPLLYKGTDFAHTDIRPALP
jgi:ribonuclease VapC